MLFVSEVFYALMKLIPEHGLDTISSVATIGRIRKFMGQCKSVSGEAKPNPIRIFTDP